MGERLKKPLKLEKFTAPSYHEKIHTPIRINPAEGRDAFKARERQQSERDKMMREEMESKSAMEQMKRDQKEQLAFQKHFKMMEAARQNFKRQKSLGERNMPTQEVAKLSGGELKSMLKNKEAERRDRGKQ
jgi:hypothetical protein